MPSFKSILSASVVAFAAGTNAHLKLAQPPPYGTPNNSPLDATGKDFPCKGAVMGPLDTTTKMAAGQQQTMSFIGSAVHGGGSCQIALTTDKNPTKDSKWMVIKSIEGGCPSKTLSGNAPANPDSSSGGADKYDYKIPADFKPGPYTLAWTWFNNIGNREMYMNCASVEITGGSKKRDNSYDNSTYSVPELAQRDTTYPDLFKANIPTTECKTVEGGPLKFPNPGADVDHFGTGTPAPAQGSGCGGGSSSSGSGGASAGAAPQGGASTGSGSGAPGAEAASSGKVDVMASPASGSGSGSGSASSAPASPSAGAQQMQGGNTGSASPSSAPAPAAQAAPVQADAPAAPAPATQGGTSCTKPGMSICSADKKQIGTCDMSMKVVMIPVPSGTECSDGQIAWPKGGPSPQKRSRIFGRNGGLRL